MLNVSQNCFIRRFQRVEARSIREGQPSNGNQQLCDQELCLTKWDHQRAREDFATARTAGRTERRCRFFLPMLRMQINLAASLEIYMMPSWIIRFVLKILASFIPNICTRHHCSKVSMIRTTNLLLVLLPTACQCVITCR